MKAGLISDREFCKSLRMDDFDHSSGKNEVHNCENTYNSDQYAESNHISIPNILSGSRDSKSDVIMNDKFYACFCTKHDKMRKLILNGNDLYSRIGRRMQDVDVFSLLNFLRNNSDVISISLAYNSIHCQGFIDIIDHIVVHNNIIELNIQNNDIGPIGIAKMCENGARLRLKILRLNGNKFGCEAAKKIALMLRDNLFIEHVNVAEVDQTIWSLVYFVTIMRSDQDQFNNTLKILDLSRPNPACMNNFDSTHFAAMIGSMLKTNTRLTELHLQKFSFSCHDIEVMLHDGIDNETLLLLDLSCNNIGDHGIDSICNWLHRRPALAGIMLSHNIITAIGARALSFALPFSRIRLLDISYNNIEDSGTTDILNTIKKSTCMRHLRLFGNQIGHDTAQIVKRMLESGVLVQANLDVKPYVIDGKYHVAYYPADYYKQRYYNVPLYGIPQPLRTSYEKDLDKEIPSNIIFTYVDPVPMKTNESMKIIESDDELIAKSSRTIKENIRRCLSPDKCPPSNGLTSRCTDVENQPVKKIVLIIQETKDDARHYIMKWITVTDDKSPDIISVDGGEANLD